MQDESWPDTGLMLPGFQMFVTSERVISSPLTSSAAAFPARTSPQRAKKRGSRGRGRGCGKSFTGLFASYAPATSSWKTWQRSLDGDFLPYLETWPPAGMMRNGRCSQRSLLVRHIGENDSFLWPTPTARDWRSGKSSEKTRARNSRPLSERAAPGGPLNPTWVEWLMGFPIGWTDFEG